MRKLMSEIKLPITPPVAVANDLIVALIGMQSCDEPPGPDANTALIRRFPGAIISAAFGHLRVLRLVLPGGGGKLFLFHEDFVKGIRVIILACMKASYSMDTRKSCIIQPALFSMQHALKNTCLAAEAYINKALLIFI